MSKILKLMNINATAQFVLKDYEGTYSEIYEFLTFSALLCYIFININAYNIILNFRTFFGHKFGNIYQCIFNKIKRKTNVHRRVVRDIKQSVAICKVL